MVFHTHVGVGGLEIFSPQLATLQRCFSTITHDDFVSYFMFTCLSFTAVSSFPGNLSPFHHHVALATTPQQFTVDL
jgi:hypothetical protein